jgi:hypothetical protein
MLTRARLGLIRLLAGRDTVVLNAEIHGSVRAWPGRASLIAGNDLHGPSYQNAIWIDGGSIGKIDNNRILGYGA